MDAETVSNKDNIGARYYAIDIVTQSRAGVATLSLTSGGTIPSAVIRLPAVPSPTPPLSSNKYKRGTSWCVINYSH
jgi:hypothetical protein